jgi:hypothetical protein
MGVMMAQPTTKKNNTILYVGIGCGVLFLLGICVSTGVAIAVSQNDSGGDFADEVNAMADDVLKASRGEMPSADWNPGAPEGLNATTAAARGQLATLGSEPEILMTAVELEAYAPLAPASRRLRGMALVFPDGRVRYSDVTYMLFDDASFITYEPFPRGNDRERILAEAVESFVQTLADDCEEIELVTDEDLADVPDSLRAQILSDSNVGERDNACNQALAIGPDTFTVHELDDVVVVVRGPGEQVAQLRTQFHQGGPGNTSLSAVDVRIR